MITTAIFIYLSGYVASYFMCRTNFRQIDHSYTIGNRTKVFGMSILSWFMFSMALLIYIKEVIIDKNIESDKPAKW